ncbi:ATP-binding cassette domain-containing protein [Sphingomonas sp. QA11]|uniref:ABC-F family ATP-binding cassette domain-containing protein n=1 Tax=Sphingomonas sp. QA11 TaxID=2950605 RepID=UPI00234B291C|nr:ABC-F family ATP-binding cassette domain-containing protein [Sphingomonas sp. QA11]WCM25406.1 ATP-binding cassette domain-containing protein [Sphingomonas sp. QA11]
MPAISVSQLSWSTPDHRPVLVDLSLSFGAERAGLVGRNGVGKSTLLKLIAGQLPVQSGRISASGTIGVLHQVVQVRPDETVADLFGATGALALLRRAEEGVASLEELGEADWTLEDRIASALGRVGLDAGPDTLLTALSGGQRTRARLAGMVFAEPDFLLLDEPTNDLDRAGRDAVIALLAGWRAGAIVVSHDRELLDTMDSIVEMTSLGTTRYGGNWTHYRERKAIELTAAERDLTEAERQMTEVARGIQETAERKARKDGAGKRKGARGDMPRILIGARKDRAEDSGGENRRLAERQRTQAAEAAAAARERVEVLQPFAVTLAPTGLPANRVVLEIKDVTAGHETGTPVLRNLSLTISGPERVAVTGPNGSGKTTLLGLITGALAPWSGTVRVQVDLAMLDQRVSLLDPHGSIRDNYARINGTTDENACRAALARFMFRADAALQIVSTLSGGQMLRAGLACVLGGERPPSLLILDEPTNHLDLDSIEAVEAGLAAYDGALLVVSHDEAFLDAIGVERRVALGGTQRDDP